MSESPDLSIVVGLGNPGPAYAGQRHNVGATAVAELAAREGVVLKRGRARLSRVLRAAIRLDGRRVMLATLTTYMNESGPAVTSLLGYYKVAPASLIVIHDELDLPYGTIRIKQGGGDNGHNGLRSVTRSLATPDYIRIRVGIGRPVGRQSPADFVLDGFTVTQRSELPAVLDEILHTVTMVCTHDVTHSQNELHRR